MSASLEIVYGNQSPLNEIRVVAEDDEVALHVATTVEATGIVQTAGVRFRVDEIGLLIAMLELAKASAAGLVQA